MAEIGKNVIENLTSAMYENSYTVYREYIQNAADSIDNAVEMGLMSSEDALIDIFIDKEKRRISINDNARGIPAGKFVKILSDIADSEKDKAKDKGFRGIGRLAGVAYCDKLIFKSSYVGEDIVSIMEWDGIKLREILADSSKHPSASELVDDITYSFFEDEEIERHYFEVILEKVIPESDDLLDEHEIIEYLQAVAPVPFANSFMYRSKIREFCKKEQLRIDEYIIQVNGNQLFKSYRTKIYEGPSDNKKLLDEISDLEFRMFKSKKGRILGWMWFGVTKYEKQIPVVNKMRGIRLRKENIQIGNEETLAYPKFFKEPRGNTYFVGEIYAVDPELIPNARRDYFNTNAVCKEFEEQLKPLLYSELYSLYHYANRVKKSFQHQAEFLQKEQEFNNNLKNAGFISDEDKKAAKNELESAKEKAQKAKRVLELRQIDANSNNTLKRVFTEIETHYKPEEKKDASQRENVVSDEKNNKYLTQSLSKYGKKEQKLISRIYTIIKAMLPKDMADMVVTKIQEELSK